MTWVRVDDHFDDHPKVAGLSDDLLGLWLRLNCWARRQKSPDGFLPSGVAEAKAGGKERLRALAGLVDPVLGGWMIHNFKDYGPPPDLSAKRSEAGQKGGMASASKRRSNTSKTEAIATAKRSTGSPEPVPVKPESFANAQDSERRSATVGEIMSGRANWVQVFVDRSRELRLTDPSPQMKARVGQVAKAAKDRGADPKDINEALTELLRRNESPANFDFILGDVERQIAGIAMGRSRPNPIDERIKHIRDNPIPLGGNP